MTDLSPVIRALEACSGADHELDVNIHIALGLSGTAARHYTGSVDAAASLIPEGWRASRLCELPRPAGLEMRWRWTAELRFFGNEDLILVAAGEGPTMALALAAAALRARGTK
jgi:hypothetical protein